MLKLPLTADGTGTPLVTEMLKVAKLYFDLYFYEPRYQTGPLIGDVLEQLDKGTHEDGGKKRFLLYSGHDSGPMGPLLGLLNVRCNIEIGFGVPFARKWL